jgi:hypothetical protein
MNDRSDGCNLCGKPWTVHPPQHIIITYKPDPTTAKSNSVTNYWCQACDTIDITV